MKLDFCITKILGIGALSLIFTLASHGAKAEVVDIDNDQLQQLLSKGVPIIDIRLKSEWDETGVVKGSKLATFFDERGRYDAAAWLDSVKGFAKKTEPVIVICRSGNRTKMVSQFMSQQAGYPTVYNVKYGIQGWMKSGGMVTKPQHP
jgi:rhodanese-related sulfurtransferase